MYLQKTTAPKALVLTAKPPTPRGPQLLATRDKGPAYMCLPKENTRARDIRTDYYVVSPHNLREPSGLA